MTLELFSRRMEELGRRIDRNVPRFMRRLALAVDQAVVTATPVDTGRARSNWRASVNAPLTGEVDTYGPGGAATAGAIAQARSAVQAVDSSRDVIYISNNLPYIGRLNDGSSAQAPAGFVQQGVQAATNATRAARLLERSFRD